MEEISQKVSPYSGNIKLYYQLLWLYSATLFLHYDFILAFISILVLLQLFDFIFILLLLYSLNGNNKKLIFLACHVLGFTVDVGKNPDFFSRSNKQYY